MKKTTLAEKIRQRMEADPDLAEAVRTDRLNSFIARQVRERREAAGLSQSDLARLVGTSQSVISRIEDADYTGHSLSLIRRIGAALGSEVTVVFGPPSEQVARRPEGSKKRMAPAAVRTRSTAKRSRSNRAT